MNNDPNQETLQQKWEKFSELYYQKATHISSTIATTLSALGRIHQRDKVLDVGCGPGIQTKRILPQLKNNSVLYSLDFSANMIKFLEEELKNYDDFQANKENHFEVIDLNTYKNKLDVDTDIKNLRETKKGKIVKVFQADAEKLNIADDQFELYLCNYVVHLTLNPQNLINEAYRVLKPGGQAVFSVWGKIEDSTNFHAIEKLGGKIDTSKYDFHDNKQYKTMLEKAGFKRFKMEYVNTLIDVYTTEDFVNQLQNKVVLEKVNNLDKDAKQEKMNEINKVCKEYEDSDKLTSLNTMIFSVFK